MRVLSIVVCLVWCWVSALASDRSLRDPAHVTFTLQADKTLKVSIELRTPVSALHFNALPDKYRDQHWRIESRGFSITRQGDMDTIYHLGGAKFDRLEITTTIGGGEFAKHYQPVAHFGTDGALIYTGHYWPHAQSGHPFKTRFTARPSATGRALINEANSTRGEPVSASQERPFYIYIGDQVPSRRGFTNLLIDEQTPAWLIREANQMLPVVFNKLADQFEKLPERSPIVFMRLRNEKNAGRMRYSGDAVNAQFQISLYGGGWKAESQKALRIFQRATIHEAAHLWHAEKTPVNRLDDAPWIHEGGAEAISAEMMTQMRYWSAADEAAFVAENEKECAKRLRPGTLQSMNDRGDYRAHYVCGILINRAAAAAANMSVGDFWRGYIKFARTNGYTAKSFFEFVAESSDPATASYLRNFVRTRHSDPKTAVAELAALAPGRLD